MEFLAYVSSWQETEFYLHVSGLMRSYVNIFFQQTLSKVHE